MGWKTDTHHSAANGADDRGGRSLLHMHFLPPWLFFRQKLQNPGLGWARIGLAWALCRARVTGRSWPHSRADRESAGLIHNKGFSHEAGTGSHSWLGVSQVTFLKDPQWAEDKVKSR